MEVLAKLCATSSRRAVVDALMDTKKLSKHELERLIDELTSSPALASPGRPLRSKGGTKADGSPAARIKRLLTVEAGLTLGQSMVQLRGELANTIGASLPPTVGTFDNWLNRVLETLPAGEVLNAAMMVAGRTKN